MHYTTWVVKQWVNIDYKTLRVLAVTVKQGRPNVYTLSNHAGTEHYTYDPCKGLKHLN